MGINRGAIHAALFLILAAGTILQAAATLDPIGIGSSRESNGPEETFFSPDGLEIYLGEAGDGDPPATAVPAPGALLLAAFGTIGVGYLRQRGLR